VAPGVQGREGPTSTGTLRSPMTVQDLLRHTAGLPYGELAERRGQGRADAGRALLPGVINSISAT
jgi:CubicO group peptidase (beta-lactamase class C family)